MDQSQGERAVGARPDPDPLRSRGAGGFAKPVVDDHDPRPPAAGLQQASQFVGGRIGAGVGAPHQDQIGISQVLFHVTHIVAEAGAGGNHAVGHVAERTDPGSVGRAEREEHGVGRRFDGAGRGKGLIQAEFEVAAPGVEGHRLRTPHVRDLAQAGGDSGVGFVPANALEGRFSCPPPLRVKETVGGVDDLRRRLPAGTGEGLRMAVVAQRRDPRDLSPVQVDVYGAPGRAHATDGGNTLFFRAGASPITAGTDYGHRHYSLSGQNLVNRRVRCRRHGRHLVFVHESHGHLA